MGTGEDVTEIAWPLLRLVRDDSKALRSKNPRWSTGTPVCCQKGTARPFRILAPNKLAEEFRKSRRKNLIPRVASGRPADRCLHYWFTDPQEDELPMQVFDGAIIPGRPNPCDIAYRCHLSYRLKHRKNLLSNNRTRRHSTLARGPILVRQRSVIDTGLFRCWPAEFRNPV